MPESSIVLSFSRWPGPDPRVFELFEPSARGGYCAGLHLVIFERFLVRFAYEIPLSNSGAWPGRLLEVHRAPPPARVALRPRKRGTSASQGGRKHVFYGPRANPGRNPTEKTRHFGLPGWPEARVLRHPSKPGSQSDRENAALCTARSLVSRAGSRSWPEKWHWARERPQKHAGSHGISVLSTRPGKELGLIYIEAAVVDQVP